MSVTSALLSHDAARVYMAGKEGGVSCCDVATGKRLAYAPKLKPQNSTSGGNGMKGKGKQRASANDLSGHSDEVLALALSGDGKYLVSGGKDRRIGVWDVSGDSEATDGGAEGLVWVKGFRGHKDTISVCWFTPMEYLADVFSSIGVVFPEVHQYAIFWVL